jgi:hypothetical protein
MRTVAHAFAYAKKLPPSRYALRRTGRRNGSHLRNNMGKLEACVTAFNTSWKLALRCRTSRISCMILLDTETHPR